MQLYRPTAGAVYLDGVNIVNLNRGELRATRRKMQMIFQDPYASLNPRMTVGEIVADPLRVHRAGNQTGKSRRRCAHLLALVKLDPSYTNRYPHEFSGGQRQRIGVARALALRPLLVVCDEPISALDVSIQAQVVNLLVDLQRQLNLTYLFIAHDLSMVRHVCDRVAVMYLGIIVELATSHELYSSPLHPYTQALLSSVPIPDPVVEEKRRRTILRGEIPFPDRAPVRAAASARAARLPRPSCAEARRRVARAAPRPLRRLPFRVAAATPRSLSLSSRLPLPAP